MFIYKSLNPKEKSREKDTQTQFSYACSLLGTEIKTTSVPHKKPRIERLCGTLQRRLSIELRLAKIDSVEKANSFLKEFIDNYNRMFALQIDYTTSVVRDIDPSTIHNYLVKY